MHFHLHRPASPLAAAAGHRVSCPATEGDVARARKLTAGYAGLNVVSCILRRGRSLGTNAVMEVLR
jgi:hypothetical protein